MCRFRRLPATLSTQQSFRAAPCLFFRAPSGRFHPLRVAAKDPLGQTHDTAIPWSTPLKLEVVSDKLLLSDSSNNPLGAIPAPIPIQQAAGQGNLNLSFSITGAQ